MEKFRGVKIIVAGISILTVSACGFYKQKKDNSVAAPLNAQLMLSGPMSYALVNQYVFSSCVACHNVNNPKGGVALDTYASVKENLADAQAEISGGFMPPKKPLNSFQLQLLSKWVGAGAPDMISVSPRSTPTPSVSSSTSSAD